MSGYVFEMWWPGGVALGVLSALFAWVSVRTKEPGSALFAIGLGTVCAIFLIKNWLLPDFGRTSPVGLPMAGLAAICMVLGMHRYMGGHGSPWALGLVLALAWSAVAAALHVVSLAGPLTAHLSLTVLMVVPAGMAFFAGRREPCVGFDLIGLAFLVHPLCVAIAWIFQWTELRMRLTTWVPFTIAGMTLLVVAQLRARVHLAAELVQRKAAEDALRHANDTLEAKVESRTQDLTEMVCALESFNRMVSHDLRGPLSGIAGLAELSLKAVADGRHDKLPRYLELIRKQGRASVDLVTSLLKLAKLSRCELEYSRVDLDECVNLAIEQVRLARPEARRIRWRIDRLPGIQGDATLLTQVFANLFCNAAKFSAQAEQPLVEIGARPSSEGFVIHVRDNGVGFDSEHARLFEPFERLHGRAYEGNGIGLTIVRKVIESHGGRVWCESRPDQGATFFFTLGTAVDGSNARFEVIASRPCPAET